MATFDPDGRGHHILHLLDGGQMTRNAVMMTLATTLREARKVGYVITALQNAELIEIVQPGRAYAITEDGKDALERLEAGQPVYAPDAPPWSGPAVPNVRIFVGRAA